MDKEVSIVLSTENKNYRKLAQRHYGLTDEQMKGMDVHHNPARHEGGRDIPEHLFVYHETLHAAVHGSDFILWARKASYYVKERNSAPGGRAACVSMRKKQTGFFDPRWEDHRSDWTSKAGSARAEQMRVAGYPGLGSSTEAAKVAGKKAAAQRWEDPDHPELGQLAAGPLVIRQKARRLPHGPENRRRVQ